MNTFLKFGLKSTGQSAVVGSFLVAATIAAGVVGSATAWADDGHKLKAKPFEFIGTAANCGVAGSRIVTAKWLKGLGLPDNGGLNTNLLDLATNPNKNDPHYGLLLSKNGPTPDCSAPGAEIKGVKGMTVDANFELGFDYRNGTHCGAGAPRFNVDTDMGFFFVGCNAPHSPAPQDPTQWTRNRSKLTTCGSECFNATLGVPGSVPVGAKIKSIDIIFDEGTDTMSPDDPNGVGLAVIDNIDINGVLITNKRGVKEDHHDGKDDDDDDKD